jgi:hypothetical protein
MEIMEEVRKINEVLRNSRISELCDKIYCLSRSLYKLAERMYDAFDVLFFKPLVFKEGEIIQTNVLVVQLYSCSEKIHEVKVDENTTIAELFNKIFESEEIRKRLLDEMQVVLHEIVREIALSADLVRRIEEIESKVEDIRSKVHY